MLLPRPVLLLLLQHILVLLTSCFALPHTAAHNGLAADAAAAAATN